MRRELREAQRGLDRRQPVVGQEFWIGVANTALITAAVVAFGLLLRGCW